MQTDNLNTMPEHWKSIKQQLGAFISKYDNIVAKVENEGLYEAGYHDGYKAAKNELHKDCASCSNTLAINKFGILNANVREHLENYTKLSQNDKFAVDFFIKYCLTERVKGSSQYEL